MNIEIKNVSLVQPAPIAPQRQGPESVVQPASKAIRNQASGDRPPASDFRRNEAKATQSSAFELMQDEVEAQQRLAMVEKIIGMNTSLVIEKSKENQGFIYKSVDRVTGEVTRIWPLEDLANELTTLTDDEDRAAMRGIMVDAKA
jgi:hypothetical protein